ncbi:MAG TPA: hypothetical protein VFY19_10490, partial [Geminicoccaceae bacterium]|nr:hypothetical protein [Geminicoccaceae bacterium]
MVGRDRRVVALVAGLLLGLAASDAGAETTGVVPPTLALDAADPGPSLPPVGRSLFDFLTMDRSGPGAAVQAVPFPFTALIARLERELDPSADPPLQQVLIPLGRSLQRNAANPDFFAFPRAVVAVDGAPPRPAGRSGMLLQDRLYIGYQERAATLEVISYNEAAGRFEFQVVRDYRDGGQPEVFYADRPTCVACHQNQAPIFSKPLWDETNANPAIAATLASVRDMFYGIPVERGVDLPDAFDAATDRANELAPLQRVWQEGCSPGDLAAATACRASVVRAVLRYRLAGNRLPSSTQDLVPALADRWGSLWPNGLALPDGDVPNRVVLTAALDARLPLNEADALRLSTVERRLEPFEPRPPREVWRWPEHAPRLVAGWARFLAPSDLQRLDALLWRRAAPTVSYRGDCRIRRAELQVTEYRFACDALAGEANGLALRGHVRIQNGAVRDGGISPLQLAGQPDLANLAVVGGTLVRSGGEVMLGVALAERSAGLHARLTDGNAVRRLEFAWRAADEDADRFDGRATATLALDFAPV